MSFRHFDSGRGASSDAFSPRNCNCSIVVQVCGGGGGLKSGVGLGPVVFAPVNAGVDSFGVVVSRMELGLQWGVELEKAVRILLG